MRSTSRSGCSSQLPRNFRARSSIQFPGMGSRTKRVSMWVVAALALRQACIASHMVRPSQMYAPPTLTIMRPMNQPGGGGVCKPTRPGQKIAVRMVAVMPAMSAYTCMRLVVKVVKSTKSSLY